MNWWDVVKNQIASTKGKTFQLDFSEPMIEDEETCKEKLRAILKKFWELDFNQVLKKDIGSNDGRYASNEYKVNDGKSEEHGVFVSFARTNFQSKSIDTMSEEVACWFLENLKFSKKRTFTEGKVVSNAEIRIQDIKKDGRFVYSLWYNVSGAMATAFHTSIVVEKRSFATNTDGFLQNVEKVVDFQKLHQVIRNIIG